jgi:dTDP-D-glucose 4,6-dehydratase
VAGGFEQTNKETVRKVITAFNNSTKDWDKYLDFSAVRPGQDVRYALDDSKLRELGWSPKKIFDEEIPKIVEYYKDNFIW